MSQKLSSGVLKLLAGVIAGAILLTGCTYLRNAIDETKKTKKISGYVEPVYEADFNEFADQVFAAFVSTDQVSLQGMVLDAKKFGIKEAQSSWGDFSSEAEEEDWAYLEALIEVLEEYEYDDLSRGQKITYDMLMRFLEGELSVKDCPDFYDPLNPYQGNHLFLAYNLDTYQIVDKDDLDMYITLVKDIEPYVESLCEYERRREEDGLFMLDDYADMVLEDCNNTIDSGAEEFISGFEERVSEFDWLEDTEKQEYMDKNREYVEKYVIPAYELICETIEDLKGSGEDGYGLARFDGGKEYYARKVQKVTGTDMTVDETFQKIEKVALEANATMEDLIMQVNYDLLSDAFMSYTTPELIIENNLKMMNGRFPEIPDAPDELYVVKEMPESIARFAAGMYNLPQIDDPWSNVFFLNSDYTEGLDFYEVVSHECIPGHLYQTVWFLTSDNENIPLRYVLAAIGEGLGTEEGWTTYVEGISFSMAGLPELETRYVESFYQAMYTWISLLDIGINYYGWTEDDANGYFREKGLTGYFEISDDILETVDTMPTMYLSYTVGYIELKEMLDRAKETLDEDFSEEEFHLFYLETGPCTFEILNREMDEWMKGYE